MKSESTRVPLSWPIVAREEGPAQVSVGLAPLAARMPMAGEIDIVKYRQQGPVQQS